MHVTNWIVASLLVFPVIPAQATRYPLEAVVPEKCWTSFEVKDSVPVEGRFCLSNHPNTVRVLIHGAGWCPGCREEMASLVPRLKEVVDPSVVFVNIVSAGWSRSKKADMTFLKEWQKRFAIPFPALAADRSSGTDFFNEPIYIPNVVILDREQRVFYTAVKPPIGEMFAEIQRASLPRTPR